MTVSESTDVDLLQAVLNVHKYINRYKHTNGDNLHTLLKTVATHINNKGETT